jgi:glycerol-3-phosphate dehydrogenase
MQVRHITRADRFAALNGRVFDLLVIGGGITGCGIARDAALRGLSVALVEKEDFASGTSSRSSRLIHGGVRYLEHGHLHLVFESSAERRRLLRLAPHLVRPLEFTWPVYEGARIPRWKLGAGLTLYDALALFRNVGRHRRLGARAVLEHEPQLQRTGLWGGATYFDAATNDARLTLANAMGAAEAGAIIMNHAAVTQLLGDKRRVAGACIRDAFGETVVDVRAHVVVNATGPWSDRVRDLDVGDARPSVQGSKGVHIAVPRERIGNHSALTLIHPRDGRVLFVLPAGTQAIVGTTDTFTDATPDDVRASEDDVTYLLDAANAFFPHSELERADVVSAWAGIRPLLPAPADSPGAVTREHAVTVSARGMISITGGKLTTYRVMAADVMREVLGQLDKNAGGDRTTTEPLPGGHFGSFDFLFLVDSIAIDTGDAELAEHLAHAYGSRWESVWNLIRDGGADRIERGLPYTLGELRYMIRNEMACTFADLFVRRSHLAFETRDHATHAAARVADALAPDFGWDAAATRRALDDYDAEVARIFNVD